MNADLKVALLGCGVITLRTLPGVVTLLAERNGTISDVCDPVLPNRQAVAQACANSDLREYSDFKLMLDESDCNVVFIATPIGLHFEHVRQALEAGRNVYCHKTLADSADKCNLIGELAKSRNLRLAASPGQMLLPAYVRARDIVHSGELGTIVSIDTGTEAAPHRYEAERAREKPINGRPFSWEWYHKRNMGGGPLDDMFVYPLAFLTELLGDVTGVAAAGRIVTPQIQWKGRIVEADARDSYAGLIHIGPIPVTFRASFSANGCKTRWGTICIRGTKGCLEIEKCDDLSYQLYLNSKGRPLSIESHDVFDSDGAASIGSTECHVLTDMAELLSACLETRPVRGATARNAARVANGLSAIKQSADHDGSWVVAERSARIE